MIQEYLIQDLSEKDAVKAYKPKDIKKRMFSADNGNCWYVQFSLDGENEKIAKNLSEIGEHVRSAFHVTVLEDGASAYFNKRLYPLVSGFEYKMRKLLYLTSAINHDEKSSANITDLESQDFGQIFTLLFIDTTFMEKVKTEIKNRNRDFFSKTDVIAEIEAIDENTLWDVLLGKDSVPTLRKHFNDVRVYRNDVMHSHHLSWQQFRKIRFLYKTINNELTKALHDIEIVESKVPSKPSFNQTLENALQAQKNISSLTEALRPIIEETQRLSEMHVQIPALIELTKELRDASSAFNSSPELRMMREQISELCQPNPELRYLQEQMKELCQPSPALRELQEQIKAIVNLKVDLSPTIQQLHDITQGLNMLKIEAPLELSRLKSSLEDVHIQNEPPTLEKTEGKHEHTDDNNENGEKNDGENENGVT